MAPKTQNHTELSATQITGLNKIHALIECEGLTPAKLSEIMCEIYGGTDAGGVWDWRQAFDLMQAASLMAAGRCARSGGKLAEGALEQITRIAQTLPTETRRSERQMQLQQFSTPLTWAWVAVQAAGLRPQDLVLEPSAGVGALAVLAKSAGAKVVANEIDPRRRALAAHLLGGLVTDHDAEFIDDLMERGVHPSVCLMNPPFASSSARGGDGSIALRHVLSAAKRLSRGGRLVAIVPPSVSKQRGGALWTRLCEEVTPSLRLVLPRQAFAKMGTHVETHLLICDKTGDGASKEGDLRALVVSNPEEALAVLASHLPARAAVSVPALPLSGANQSSTAQNSTKLRGSPTPTRIPPRTPSRAGMILPGRAGGAGAGAAAAALEPLAITIHSEPRAQEAVSDVYARYAPQRIAIEGAKPHPTSLVESLAMASVAPPAPLSLTSGSHSTLSLPPSVREEGLLSEAQLETVIMAEAAFAQDLPGRFIQDEEGRLIRKDDAEDTLSYRKGYFLGDGTGCGKGRQVAGLIMAGWSAGRRRALWVSRSSSLIEDAARDWRDLGGAATDIHAVSKWGGDEVIKLHEGILFVTYATLRAVSKRGKTRLEQVLAWLGPDFDGVIAFDEAHAMQNAGGGSSRGSEQRGERKGSQQGLAGLKLQQALPRARVLYVSATGATQVANLAYASRLGLWGSGPGYAFASRESFVTAMEAGGVAAMEVVARDLKAMGLYTARALSFEGVEYDILEHQLSEDQIAIYDAWAGAFQTIHSNLHAALKATGIVDAETGGSEAGSGAAKSSALSVFESTKQRFFGHLLQGLKMPKMIEAMRADIAEGWAPVVQIVSTGEALLKRRIEGLDAQDDLSEAALTPRDYVLSYLQNAFPVAQMQLVEQEDGSVIAQPLRDSAGEVVISREAEAMRDAMIEELMLLAPVASALDQLIWAFGSERVAEVTGRSLRPIKREGGRLRIERRSASANAAETDAFMSGEKDILIFSDAGGTGRSYHAAEGAQNQKAAAPLSAGAWVACG